MYGTGTVFFRRYVGARVSASEVDMAAYPSYSRAMASAQVANVSRSLSVRTLLLTIRGAPTIWPAVSTGRYSFELVHHLLEAFLDEKIAESVLVRRPVGPEVDEMVHELPGTPSNRRGAPRASPSWARISLSNGLRS